MEMKRLFIVLLIPVTMLTVESMRSVLPVSVEGVLDLASQLLFLIN